VTLLGDAAHAMTPNLGQGACQAIESALVLGLEVQKSDDLTAAFANYARIRQPRVHQVIKAARQLGAIAQWSNPVATAMRNVVFKSVPSSMLRRQLADSWKLPYGGFSTD
jgi:2-polyprenyl-6-methoxyphenol hydroxylase-like FAD-dependent oxidoreductase